MTVDWLAVCRRAAQGAHAALASYPLREELSGVEAPTLIVWGTHDTLVGAEQADELERLIPHASKVVFERTGHVPMLERPARFNEVVDDFIAAPASVPDGEVVA